MVPGYIYKCPSQIFHMFGLPNYPWEAAMMVEGLVKVIRDASTQKSKRKFQKKRIMLMYGNSPARVIADNLYTRAAMSHERSQT